MLMANLFFVKILKMLRRITHERKLRKKTGQSCTWIKWTKVITRKKSKANIFLQLLEGKLVIRTGFQPVTNLIKDEIEGK